MCSLKFSESALSFLTLKTRRGCREGSAVPLLQRTQILLQHPHPIAHNATRGSCTYAAMLT